MRIRAVRDEDAAGLIKLIGDCFSEYDGVFLELDGLDKDLHAYASYLKSQNGKGFVAVTEEGNIAGSVACALSGDNRYELKRLYLDVQQRGSGMGLQLLRLVENIAVTEGASEMEAWSDTRFTRAHRFYEREGYVRQDFTRDLNDISNTTEYCFIKQL